MTKFANLLAIACLVSVGCQAQQAPEKLVPVQGKITVGGQPLTYGTIVFHPDPDKGNTSKHEPRGTIRAEKPGVYELETGEQLGAPAGWYRVTVYAMKTESSTKPPVWLANQKFTDVKTSGLSAEVTEGSTKPIDFGLTK